MVRKVGDAACDLILPLSDLAAATGQEALQAGQQAAPVKGEDRFPAAARGGRRLAVGEGGEQARGEIGGQVGRIAGDGEQQRRRRRQHGGMQAGERTGEAGDAVGRQAAAECGVAFGIAVAVDEYLADLRAQAFENMLDQRPAGERLQPLVHAAQTGRQAAGENDRGNVCLRHNPPMIPHYWSQAVGELAAADVIMAGLLARYPGIGLQSRGDPFGTLARSIVGQQISVKAADAVWARFAARLGEVSPAAVLAAGPAGLADCGLSRRKIEYVCDLAGHFAGGRVRPERWAAMDDEAVIAELADVRGIGRWTAEMFLIFNQLRPDVFPLDDIGLQKAVGMHYFGGEKPARRVLAEFGQRWRPWRTVATWYLWRSLDPLPVEY